MGKKHPLDVYREAERTGRAANLRGATGRDDTESRGGEERGLTGRRQGPGRGRPPGSRRGSGRGRLARRGLWMEDLAAAASGLSGPATLVVGGTLLILLAGAFALGYVTGLPGATDAARAGNAGAGPPALQVSETWPGADGDGDPAKGTGTDGGEAASPVPPRGAGPEGTRTGTETGATPESSGAWRVRVEIYERGNAPLAEHWRQVLSDAGFADAEVLPVADAESGATALRLYVGRAGSKDALTGLLERIKRFEDPRQGGRAFVNAGVEYVVVDRRSPRHDAAEGGS